MNDADKPAKVSLPTVPTQPTQPMVCRFLRTKTSFGTRPPDGPDWRQGNSTTAVYWCLETMETAGADGGFAHAHRCREGRSCFESSEVAPSA
jgi:hypothetical protein